MTKRQILYLAISISLLAVLPATAQVSIPPTQPVDVPEKPYRSLTNTQRSFTNLNVEVVRGFVVDGDSLG